MIPKYKSLSDDKRCIVTIEKPDGAIYRGFVADWSMQQEYEMIPKSRSLYTGDAFGKRYEKSMPAHWTITLYGVGDLEVIDIPAAVTEKATANEWACEWCGSHNDKERKQCSQCGGCRSFLYDL